MPDKLQKFKDILNLLSESLTKDEFLKSFQAVIDFIKKSEVNLENKIDEKVRVVELDLNSKRELLNELSILYKDTIKKIEEDNQSTLSNLKRWALERVGELFIKSKVNEQLQGVLTRADERLGQIDDKIKEIDRKEWPNSSVIALEASKMAQDELLPLIPTIPKLEEELPKLGLSIRDGLENLADEDKLEIKAIKDLRKELDELKKNLKAGSRVTSGGGVGKHNMEVYDISGSLNGVTKTFNLPAFWQISLVLSTSAPQIFRPTTDFTWTPTSVTFTNEITAATTLAAGQTVLVIGLI